MDRVTGQDGLAYREAAPCAELKPWVARYYAVRSCDASPGEIQAHGSWIHRHHPLMTRLLPNGDANLVFDLGARVRWARGVDASPARSFALGVVSEPVAMAMPRGVDLIGVAFAIGRAQPFLEPAAALRDRRPALSAVWGAEAARLEARLRATTCFRERVAHLERALCARLPRRIPAQRDLRDVLEEIAARPGRVRVDALARSSGLTRQHFTRWFTQAVGMGPKTIIRLNRVQAVLDRVMRTGAPSWSRLAAEFGYSDQAHLIHEFRRTIGIAPGRFLLRHRALTQRS